MTVRDERWRQWLAFAALGCALAPIVVAVGRAVVSGWAPTLDAGYFPVRARDVLTSHHPWLGAWSSASASVGATVRNLGPLQLDLLAPFAKVDPYWGTAVGVGVVAAASVVAVWWAARRVLGPVGAAAAMLATVAVEATIGSQPLMDPRQQIYLLMPFWAFLWLTWATASGLGAALPPLVFVSSLITQTHFTYLLQIAVLTLVGLGLYIVTVRARWRAASATRWLLVGLTVAAVCWAQPIWDQIAGDRNLGAVLANRSADEGIGWSGGARFVASTVLVPPDFWRPGTMGELQLHSDIVSQRVAWFALVLWFVALAVSASAAWLRHHRALAMIPVVGAVTLVAAVLAGAAIPPTILGFGPQNYYWMWPTGVFITVGVLAGGVAWAAPLRRALASVTGELGLTVASLLVAVIAFHPVDHFSTVASARESGARVARPVLDEVRAALRRHDITGPLVIDYSRASFGNYVRYTVLAELQRAGIGFTFSPDDPSVHRFGRERCERGQAQRRLVVADAGGDPILRPGETVLVHVDAFSDADTAQLESLARNFGEWLREGTVALDGPAYEFLFDRPPPGYAKVMSTPGRTAAGMSTVIAAAQDFGIAVVPASLHDDVTHWEDLEKRAALDDVTILLAPATPVRDSGRRGVRAAACLD